MEEKLLQELKNHYKIMLVSMMILLSIAVFWFLATLLTYLGLIELVEMKEGTEIKVQLVSVALVFGAIVAVAVTLRPYGKDLGWIRKHEYRMIEATFVRYDYQLVGDEDSRLRAVPLFQDTLTKEIMTFTLEEKELERDVCYRIGYLPNTRIAVIERIG